MECSESTKAAVIAKQGYQYMMAPVSKKLNISDDLFEKYIDRFNSDLNKMLYVGFTFYCVGVCARAYERVRACAYVYYFACAFKYTKRRNTVTEGRNQ